MIFLVLAIFCTSCGMVFYKLYMTHKRHFLLGLTISLFILAPVFSFLALQVHSIDTVYMATSLNGLIILFLSRALLKEKINVKQYAGAAMVTFGVVIYMI